MVFCCIGFIDILAHWKHYGELLAHCGSDLNDYLFTFAITHFLDERTFTGNVR